jgi:hypothetical protein
MGRLERVKRREAKVVTVDKEGMEDNMVTSLQGW